MRSRLAPFLILLEARYLPLLFAVAPQAYAVYLWLFPQPYNGTGEVFAVLGAIGYEFIYVGAIAWAEEGRAGRWTWITAGVALIFSVAVAVYVYLDQGWWSILHAGFPVVAFAYTMQLHRMIATPQTQAASPPHDPLAEKKMLAEQMRQSRKSWREIADAVGRSPSTVRGWLEGAAAQHHNNRTENGP